MKEGIKVNRKVGIVGVLLVVFLAAVLVIAKGKLGGSVGDDAAIRSKPKAAPAGAVDPNVISRGTSLWQGQSYMMNAKNALNMVNQQRAGSGLAALEWDDSLAACAMIRATELPSLFSHSRPDGTDWYTVAPNIMYGENLAQGYNSPDAAVNAWMNSPAHRDNIMNASFKSCGIGIYEAGGKWYWGQEFGYY